MGDVVLINYSSALLVRGRPARCQRNWRVRARKEAKAQAASVLAFEAYQIRASGLTHRKTIVKGSS